MCVCVFVGGCVCVGEWVGGWVGGSITGFTTIQKKQGSHRKSYMEVYENMKVIESFIEVYGNMQVIKNHTIV